MLRKKDCNMRHIKLFFFQILFFFLFLRSEAADIQYRLASVQDHEISISFSLKGNFTNDEDTFFFAYPLLPTKQSEASVIVKLNSSSGNNFLPSKKHSLIRSGNVFLQWCSFSLKSPPSRDGTILIKYSTPLLRGINKDSFTISNGIIKCATLMPLSKNRSAIPHIPFSTGLRIEASEDGIYCLTSSQLRKSGIPVDKILSSTYRMFNKNSEIPIFISNNQNTSLGENDFILFYGKYLRAESNNFEQFSNTNIYWLTWGAAKGARVVEISGEPKKNITDYNSKGIIRAKDFEDTIHLETDSDILYLGNITNPPEHLSDQPYADTSVDNWHWSFIGEEELTSHNISLPSPGTGKARMQICFTGLSNLDSVINDHQIRILINNNPIGEQNTAIWDGQKIFIFTSNPFEASLLKAGLNKFSFLCPSRSYTDRTALNWIKIYYPRNYQSVNNSIKFKNSPDGLGKITEYNITGFNTDQIELWDVDRNIVFTKCPVTRGNSDNPNHYTLTFQDSVNNNTTYLAQSKQLRLTPAFMILDTIKNDWHTFANCQHITISTDSFRTELKPLIDFHNSRGLRAAFVDIDDIYNSFSAGIRDPESIRSFLKYVFSISISNLPRYLLLGGDTSHDTDKKNRNKNIIPTHLSRAPNWGPAADDGYFATINGDDAIPDLSVGRLPAENRIQMRTIIQKTIRYIKNPNRGFWRDNLLLLGGGENVFTRFNDDAVNETIRQKINVTRIDADSGSLFYKDGSTAPKIITDKINSGVFLINFNGHGGGNIWSDNNFFGFKELQKLYNGRWENSGRLPMVFSFTCLTGFFESTTYRSLGEEFLRTDHNGCIGFYGASAYTSQKGNLLLNKLTLETALNSESQTIGEIIDFCELSMLVRYGSQYLPLIRQYNLLGDPALPWQLTPDTLQMTLNSTSLKNSDSLQLVCKTSPVANGSLRLLVNAGNDQLYQNIYSITDGSVSDTIHIKKDTGTFCGSIRAYAWNDSNEVRGWINFSKDTIMVTDIHFTPENIYFGDSILIYCKLLLDSSMAPADIYCRFTVGTSLSSNSQSFSGVRMISAGNNTWVTLSKIPLDYKNNINDRLLLYFRIITSVKSLESELFSFDINGRPDLLFTDDSLNIEWDNDSLRINAQILNTGNATAPPFQLHFFWNNADKIEDTMFILTTQDSLPPGKFRNFSYALPDTQGKLYFTGWVNFHNSFLEVNQYNNRTSGFSNIKYKDLTTPADTLLIDGKYTAMIPAHNFNSKKRVFTFIKPVTHQTPLETGSKWTFFINNFPMQISSVSRPAPVLSDSVLWIFNHETPFDANYKPVVMTYDTITGNWKYAGGSVLNNSIQFKATMCGTFSAADLNDLQSPDIQVASAGRFLNFSDYAAKNKPFSILISDPSGIDPQSVKLYLNNKELDSSCISSIEKSDDLNNLSITAYPKPQHKVDSLQIKAMDLAGNISVKTVSYLPGEELSIKFLACHPNPFTARQMPNGSIRNTRFAFLLTDVADDISLTIYTVSGRAIRSWSLSSLIGYQEIGWDGRDKDGARIANGTYYAKLVAKNKQKKVSKTVRIAKLEGYY